MGDDQTNLVDVACQQHPKGSLGIQNCDDIAGVVGKDPVAMGCHFLYEPLLQRDFIPRDCRAVQQGEEKIFIHYIFPLKCLIYCVF